LQAVTHSPTPGSIKTVAVVYPAQFFGRHAPAPQTLAEPSTGDNANTKSKVDVDTSKLGNTNDQSETPVTVTKPRPLQIVRDSLNVDPKPPAATRPTGNGPLKRIANALTGQKAAEAETKAEKPAEKDAA
jgi:hypothetical protein